jgi:RHS repeat-associated protein
VLYDYTYDAFNQLTEEVIRNVEDVDKTIKYSYDLQGNITSIKTYKYLDEDATPLSEKKMYYQNVWKDQLTRIEYYTNGVLNYYETLSYDDSGNVINQYDSRTSYFNKSFQWDGRQLTNVGSYCNSFSYQYNDQGIRTQKTQNTCSGGITTNYVLDDDKVLVETSSNGNTIYYTYDVDGSLLSMNYNGSEYFYITNLQGDVIELVDISGITVATYKYDAWGNTISKTGSMADINPYRYRGYRFDSETGYYYLQSRYYNPQIGRFISADGILGEVSNLVTQNMYAYTGNNPVMNIDPDGDSFILLALGAAVLLVVLRADDPQTVIEQDLVSGKIFHTYEDAADAWGKKNGALTKNDLLERGAFVYTTVRHDGKTYYMLSKTYKGENQNVVGGFIRGYAWSAIRGKFGYDVVGFIHTHPNEHGTFKDNTSNADDFLVYLPGISRGSVYDTNGIGIHYNRSGHFGIDGNYYPSNSNGYWEALWLMIINGHG